MPLGVRFAKALEQGRMANGPRGFSHDAIVPEKGGTPFGKNSLAHFSFQSALISRQWRRVKILHLKSQQGSRFDY